jgi:transcriptional regulator with XRE-family HTH domain
MSQMTLAALADLREKTGLSYVDLGVVSGIKPATLFQLETRFSNPRSDTLLALIEALAKHLNQSADGVFEELFPDILNM